MVDVTAWFVEKLQEAAASESLSVDIDFRDASILSLVQREQLDRIVQGGVRTGTFEAAHNPLHMTTTIHLTPEGAKAFARHNEAKRVEEITKEGVFSDRRVIQLEDE